MVTLRASLVLPWGLAGAAILGCLASTVRAQGITWGNDRAVLWQRSQAALVYDAARARTVMFGGTYLGSTIPINETWEWDGRAWTKMLVPNGPMGRINHSMGYDLRRGVTVLFGGLGLSLRSDTHEWDGEAWRLVSPQTAPPARQGAAMCWHGNTQGGEILMFGGRGAGDVPLQDTWAFDGTDWVQRSAGGPGPRSEAAMAFVPTVGRTFLVGGRGNSDPWSWDGSQWWSVNATGVVPVGMEDHAMTFDLGRQQLVLVGGNDISQSNEATFFGSVTGQTNIQWTAIYNRHPVTNQIFPPDMAGVAMAYDTARRCQVYTSGLLYNPGGYNIASDIVYELNATGTWIDRTTPVATPSARAYTELSFDPVRGQAVLFGGWNGAPLGDTWTHDGTSWTNRGTSSQVAPRAQGAMTFLPSLGQTLMFGGTDLAGTYFGDTQLWTGSGWVAVLAFSAPSPRTGHDMVYDSARGKVVLFGGIDTTGVRQDTWEYDPNGFGWSQVATVGSPARRQAHRMAYDERLRRTVMFGGAGNLGQFLGDTWLFDGATRNWTAFVGGAAPSARWNPGMAYDPGRGVSVLTGGYSLGAALNDVWEFTGTSWRQRAPSTDVPVGREGAGMTYDSWRQELLVFGGGTSAGPKNELWVLGAVADHFGEGHANVADRSRLRSTSYPVEGGTARFRFASPGGFGWLTLNLGPAPVAGYPLATPMACGSPGQLYSTPGAFSVTPVVGNPAEYQFGIPMGFGGVALTMQGIGLDAQTMCFHVSDPLMVTLQRQ